MSTSDALCTEAPEEVVTGIYPPLSFYVEWALDWIADDFTYKGHYCIVDYRSHYNWVMRHGRLVTRIDLLEDAGRVLIWDSDYPARGIVTSAVAYDVWCGYCHVYDLHSRGVSA
jgi:hypothetical protein